MRTIVPGLIILSLVLSGCNLPFGSGTAPTPDLMATQVTQRLTSAPGQTRPPGAATSPAQATLDPLAKTASPAGKPSLTIPPTQTAVKTATAGDSSAQKKTPSATSIPGDPRGSLGTPTWKDDFQKASTWELATPYDDGHTRVSIESGKLILKSLDANGWRGWRMMNQKIQNFYLEATIKPLTCTGNDQYGIVFRSTDNFKGFWFSLTCDGKYAFQSGDINNFTDLFQPKTNPNIVAGSNQVQRMGIIASANKFSLYANGKLLEDFTSDAFPDAGAFGYFITGNQTPGFTIESTEIDYWMNP